MVRSKSNRGEAALAQTQEALIRIQEALIRISDPIVPLWEAEDVMIYLGIGRDRVYQLVNEEELPFILFGKQEYRFYPFATRDWAKEKLQIKKKQS